MDRQRWENIKCLFDRALSLAPEDRNRFLAEVCGDDSALRTEVESLLDHDQPTNFLDRGPSQLLGSLIPKDDERFTFQTGEVIAGRFKIVRFIGRGGMGEVYEAEDLELGARVALKTLRPEISSDAGALNRFKQEVQLARRVTHPNVCRMFDMGRHHAANRAGGNPSADHLFLSMELLDGESLSELLCRTGRMNIQEAWPIVRQIGEALQSAHEAGVIHRDFKPSNVILARTKSSEADQIRAVVTDFGLARAATMVLSAGGEHSLESLSVSGRMLGTPAYMAPEQIEGRPATAASDIYAFGLVLYEIVTGARPFGATTPISSAVKRLTQPPPTPRTLVPSLSPVWESVILRCLEREPANRYRTIQEAIKGRTESAGPIQAPARMESANPALALQTTPARATSALVRRAGTWFPLATAAVSVCVLTAGLLLWTSRNDRRTSTPSHLEYTRLTDFADSVTYPALSPDGRMLAMIRGDDPFLGPGDVWVKMLPSGQPVQLTHDGRPKAKPAFSPDGSRIAFTRAEGWDWQTWTVPVLGGEASELLPNAPGLTWVGPHQVMFSEMGRPGYLKIVTASESRADERDVYLPPPDAMAHWSYLSPDSKWVLVVDMDSEGWTPCRLVAFAGGGAGKQVGPVPSQCAAAAWSPDGRWMYFSADTGGGFHLWRQRFPNGAAEQITFGATEERGIAVAPDGRSLITAIGSQQSTIWLHTQNGERQISSEGFAYKPSFSSDGKSLYYLVRDSSSKLSGELTSVDLTSGRKEQLLPAIPIALYALSPDSRNVAFTRADEEDLGIWISPLDRRSSPRRLVSLQADMPVFSRSGDVFFVGLERKERSIFRIKQDGTGLQKLVPDPVNVLISISPDGRWIVASTNTGRPQTPQENVVAYSLDGGRPRVLCRTCAVGDVQIIGPPLISWSGDQKSVYFDLVNNGSSDRPKTVVVPVSPGEAFPRFSGSQLIDERLLSKISGARILDRADVFPGPNTKTYAICRISTQRNLYRITLP